MNLIEETISQRRTIHHYLPDKVPEDLISDVLKKSFFAPNHKLTFPARLYLVGPKKRSELVELFVEIRKEKGMEISNDVLNDIKDRFISPSHLVAISKKFSSDIIQAKEDYATVSCIVHNISLMLWPYGIGTKWTTGEIIRKHETYKILGIDQERETLEGLIWIGKPQKIKSPPKYPDFSASISYLD